MKTSCHLLLFLISWSFSCTQINKNHKTIHTLHITRSGFKNNTYKAIGLHSRREMNLNSDGYYYTNVSLEGSWAVVLEMSLRSSGTTSVCVLGEGGGGRKAT